MINQRVRCIQIAPKGVIVDKPVLAALVAPAKGRIVTKCRLYMGGYRPEGQNMTMSLSRMARLLVVLSAAVPAAIHAEQCTLRSTAHRVTVLELYTSEGCSSCPPADRWLSSLPQRGAGPSAVVPLAFHVDYWNQLGWADRFSQERFSQRQHDVAARNRSRQVYTPQLILDGRPLRAGTLPDDLEDRLRSINAQPAGATIYAGVVRQPTAVQVTLEADVSAPANRSNADIWIAAFENGLSSAVARGENAGTLLNHDFVVRDLAGPFPIPSDGRRRVEKSIETAQDWDPRRTGLAIFVQDRNTGAVLQATAMFPVCQP
jgi:hypothetical protein